MTCSTLSEISLTGPEQWAALDRFNPTWDLDFDRAGTVVSVFKHTAAAWPDKPAAVYRDKSYTYRELDNLTDALAAKLYRRACEAAGKTCLAEEVVAILLPRDENVFILPLAAIKAGLAYEPLDPSYPRERLNFMVKDAGVCLLLADENLLDLMEDYDGDVMTVRELYDAEGAGSPCSGRRWRTGRRGTADGQCRCAPRGRSGQLRLSAGSRAALSQHP